MPIDDAVASAAALAKAPYVVQLQGALLSAFSGRDPSPAVRTTAVGPGALAVLKDFFFTTAEGHRLQGVPAKDARELLRWVHRRLLADVCADPIGAQIVAARLEAPLVRGPALWDLSDTQRYLCQVHCMWRTFESPMCKSRAVVAAVTYSSLVVAIACLNPRSLPRCKLQQYKTMGFGNIRRALHRWDGRMETHIGQPVPAADSDCPPARKWPASVISTRLAPAARGCYKKSCRNQEIYESRGTLPLWRFVDPMSQGQRRWMTDNIDRLRTIDVLIRTPGKPDRLRSEIKSGTLPAKSCILYRVSALKGLSQEMPRNP